MDEILLRAVKRVLSDDLIYPESHKQELLLKMLGSDWQEQLEAEGLK